MKAMRDVWGEKLVELGEADPRTVVLDGDLANSTKADKFARAHPDRFFQMGIAEQNLVGAAAGLASVGFVPWTSSFTVFFTHRALDPIRMLVAQSHANVKIVASYSGLLIGAVGKTHLDVQDLAIMRAMPDMTVLAPADEAELLAMMDWAAAYEGPVYLRLARDGVPDLFDRELHVLAGSRAPAAPGRLTSPWSPPDRRPRGCCRPQTELEETGTSATVIHVPSLKPLDTAALVAAVGDSSLVVTVEEHSVHGGLGGLVAEVLTSAGASPRIVRIGLDDVWGESADNDFLLDKHGLSPSRIADRVSQPAPGRTHRHDRAGDLPGRRDRRRRHRPGGDAGRDRLRRRPRRRPGLHDHLAGARLGIGPLPRPRPDDAESTASTSSPTATPSCSARWAPRTFPTTSRSGAC